MRFLQIISVLMLVLFIADAQPVQVKTKELKTTCGVLTVTATSHITRKPELALIYIGVITKADTAREAVNRNSEKTEKVIQALMNLGVKRKDIKTVEYELVPMVEQNKEGEIIRRYYTVVENLEIIVRNLKKTGHILDAVVKAGVNRVYDISFGIQNENEILLKAKLEAVKEALHQAQEIAKTAGVTIKGIKEIYFGRSAGPILNMPGAKIYSANSVPIESGSLEFSATVTIKFLICGTEKP